MLTIALSAVCALAVAALVVGAFVAGVRHERARRHAVDDWFREGLAASSDRLAAIAEALEQQNGSAPEQPRPRPH